MIEQQQLSPSLEHQSQQPQQSIEGDVFFTRLLVLQNKTLTTALEPPVTGRGLQISGQHFQNRLERRIDVDDDLSYSRPTDKYIIQPKSKRFRRRRLVPIADREKEAMYNRSDYQQLHPSIDDRQRRNVLEWLRWICTKLQ